MHEERLRDVNENHSGNDCEEDNPPQTYEEICMWCKVDLKTAELRGRVSFEPAEGDEGRLFVIHKNFQQDSR